MVGSCGRGAWTAAILNRMAERGMPDSAIDEHLKAGIWFAHAKSPAMH